jgi:hypothetical protein
MLQENFRNKNCASKETSKFPRLTLFATRMTIKKFEYSKAIKTWWMRSYVLSPEVDTITTHVINLILREHLQTINSFCLLW